MRSMKALSLTQPWATLVAIGAKRIETRSWYTAYRGRLAIHAAKGFPGWANDICGREPFRSTLARAGYAPDNLPRGCVIATCRLTSMKRVAGTGLYPMDWEWRQPDGGLVTYQPSENELAFGDFSIGRWLWLFADIEPLSVPVTCRGELGLFNVTL